MTGQVVKLRKQDRELLALMATAPENVYGQVTYVPGRWHPTNAEGRTRYRYDRYQPARYGFKTYIRVTAPVGRLLDAGLVAHESPDPAQRCEVVITQAGRDWLAAYAATRRVDSRHG